MASSSLSQFCLEKSVAEVRILGCHGIRREMHMSELEGI